MIDAWQCRKKNRTDRKLHSTAATRSATQMAIFIPRVLVLLLIHCKLYNATFVWYRKYKRTQKYIVYVTFLSDVFNLSKYWHVIIIIESHYIAAE